MNSFNLYDPLPLTFFGLAAIVSSILLFELGCYLRRIVPKSVECWFCKYKTEVNYSIRNSWTCPSCEQYNGFTKDGDYNKIIASQHHESLNLSSVARQVPKNEWKKGASLCNTCNLKQQLKIQQLASFEPMSNKNYDQEVEHFREQIEKNYELCENCEKLVTKVLSNLREELSIPKKLYAAISQVSIRGQKAIYINIVLSVVLAISSLQGKISLPAEVAAYMNHLQKYVNYFHSYPHLNNALNYWIQLVIFTGFLVNSIGYYQTKAAGIFLNSCSWILMFFLTLYPAPYQEYVSNLKIISGIISVVISVFIIMKNKELKLKKAKSLREKRFKQPPQMTPTLQRANGFPNISRSASSSNLSNQSFRVSPKSNIYSSTEDVNSRLSYQTSHKSKNSPIDEVKSNINFGIGNLNLGHQYRKEPKQSSKPLLNPPKFNPFSGTKTYLGSNKNYQWKPSTSYAYNQYEPSVTPSMYDGYDSPEPSVATFTSFSCPQQCYPACPPTLAYYFSSHDFQKQAVRHTSTPVGEDREFKVHYNWFSISSVPVIFLICCNIVLLYAVYKKEMAAVES